MSDRIDAVTGGTSVRLEPVESVTPQRRQGQHDGPATAPDPGASYAPRPDEAVVTYAVPDDGRLSSFVVPDPVAPALAQALASEPWGHPMPRKDVWEQTDAVRRRSAERTVEAATTVVAATPAPAAPAQAPEPTATATVTTPAAPATQAAASGAGSAAPVFPAWLGSLLKAR